MAAVVEAVAPVAPRAALTITLATTLGATKPAGTHPPKVITPRPGTAMKDMKAATEANPPPAITPTPPARGGAYF